MATKAKAKKKPAGPEGALAALARDINLEHRRGEEADRRRLAHYRRAGECLAEARKIVPHGRGNWEAWLKANVEFSWRSAYRLMQFARFPTDAPWPEQEAEWRRLIGCRQARARSGGTDEPPADLDWDQDTPAARQAGLSGLAAAPEPGGGIVTVKVMLTEEQHREVKSAAFRLKIGLSEMARRAVLNLARSVNV